MYNILICDDEPDIVSALKIYLASDGYGIYEAYNGREAIEMMQKTEIHLVLMDIMMPEMDGLFRSHASSFSSSRYTTRKTTSGSSFIIISSYRERSIW